MKPNADFLGSPWLAYLATLASALPLAARYAAANPQPADACSGIGWGCSLYGWDAAGFILVVLGIPYAVALLVLLLLTALLPPNWRPLRTTIAWIGFAVPWLFASAVLARQPLS